MKIKMLRKIEMEIAGRKIGPAYEPLVIAEIGINHEGSFAKAVKMIDDAAQAGCECVKFQTHVIADEMLPNKVVPANAKESIWEIMDRCKLSEEEDRKLKKYTEAKGMIYLSTPFSRAGADRLKRMKVDAFKIGSGECNNYPLVEHIAGFGKPIILSTGMNNIESIGKSVKIIERHRIPYALLHCTSIYPTPTDKIRLGALADLNKHFPKAVLGLSDHSLTNFPCLASVALGASILERHFTSDKGWPGPDVPISMDPGELEELIAGSRIIYQALGGSKEILKEEQPTIDFAYACVITIKDIEQGDRFTMKNIWVKRPGTGEITARHFNSIIGKRAKIRIKKDKQLRWEHIDD